MKIQINIEKRHLLLLVAVIAIAAVGIVLAAKPNPGHSCSDIEFTEGCISDDTVTNAELKGPVVTDVRMICSWTQTTGETCPTDYTKKDGAVLAGPIYCSLCIKLA